MDSKIFEAYESAKSRSINGDFIDRLHSRFTITLLFVILGILVYNQYDGTSIVCWLPTQFSDPQVDYVHQLCWVNNTYYYPLEQDADKFPQSQKYLVHYYQFIIFIISGQIVLFYLPNMIWKVMASDSGTYINKMLEKCAKRNIIEKQIQSKIKDKEPKPEEIIKELKNQVTKIEDRLNNKAENKKEFEFEQNEDTKDSLNQESHSLLFSNDFSNEFLSEFRTLKSNIKPKRQKSLLKNTTDNKSKGTRGKRLMKIIIKPISGVERLAFFYFVLKVLNLLNVLFQIVGLRYIFGHEFYSYGIDFFTKFIKSKDPILLSKQFPIITFCDYYVHQNLRQLHFNSSQCLLVINFLIEKFFVVIWFWLIALFILTFFNIISWLIEIYIPQNRIRFIFKYIHIKSRMIHGLVQRKNSLSQQSIALDTTSIKKESIEHFYETDLGKDGIVMLHIFKAVAGDIIFIELLNEFWIDYKKRNENS